MLPTRLTVLPMEVTHTAVALLEAAVCIQTSIFDLATESKAVFNYQNVLFMFFYNQQEKSITLLIIFCLNGYMNGENAA